MENKNSGIKIRFIQFYINSKRVKLLHDFNVVSEYNEVESGDSMFNDFL